MQILKTFFLNIKHCLSALLVYLFVFFILLVLFALNGTETRNMVFESDSVDIIILDKDNSTLSKSLTDYLSERHNVKDKKYTEEQIVDELFYGSADYVLTIPKNFEINMTAGETTDIVENQQHQGNFSSYLVGTQIEQYLSLISTYLSAGYSPQEAATSAGKAATQEVDIRFSDSDKAETNQVLYTTFCYMPYILVCLLTVGLGMILITFREESINTRIQCSALPSMKYNLQLALGSIIFSLVCWVLLVLASAFLTHTNFTAPGEALYLLNSFLFLLLAMSSTYLISMLVHSETVLNMVANVVGLGLSFLGGVFVPQEFMDPTVIRFAHLLPSYWYISALDQITDYSGKSTQINSIMTCFGIEFLFAVAIFCAALAVSRQQRRR